MRFKELTLNFKKNEDNGVNTPYESPIKLIMNNQQLENLIDNILQLDAKEVLLSFKLKKENAYEPELSAVGVVFGESKYLIDLLSLQKVNITPFIENVINNQNILKVIFGIDYFLENIGRFCKLSFPLFDVEKAAMFCGYGDRPTPKSIITAKYNSVPNARTLANPKWGIRPLNNILLNYFASELALFRQAYEIVKQDLILNNRIGWFNEYINSKINSQDNRPDHSDAWQFVRFANTSLAVIKRAKSLCSLREELAGKFQVHPLLVFNDDVLKEIAEEGPLLPEDLVRIRNLPLKLKKDFYVKRIIGAIIAANKQMDSEISLEEFKQVSLPTSYTPLVDMLKILLRLKSQEYNISQKLIADVYDLATFATGQNDSVKFLDGWRYEVFGKVAIEMRNGEIGLIQEGQNTIIVKI